MSEPKLFTVSDALDLQLLQGQRTIIDQQISTIINAYGIEGPASIIQDPKGRWIGIQAAIVPPNITLVPDDSSPVDEVLEAKSFAEKAKKKKTS